MSLISERQLADRLGSSHTGVRKARLEGRAYRGVDLDHFAQYDAEKNFLGYASAILERLKYGNETVETEHLARETEISVSFPPMETSTSLSERPDVETKVESVEETQHPSTPSSHTWPWSQTVDDIVRGKPCFGGIFRLTYSKQLEWFGYAPASDPLSMQDFLALHRNRVGYRSVHLYLDTIDANGSPQWLAVLAAGDAERVVIGYPME